MSLISQNQDVLFIDEFEDYVLTHNVLHRTSPINEVEIFNRFGKTRDDALQVTKDASQAKKQYVLQKVLKNQKR